LQGQITEAQRRREGNTLYIECPYTQAEYRYRKYWCRQKPDGGYQPLLSIYYGEYQDGRTTMKDDSSRKIVSITMTDLKAEDSGTYFCAYYNHVPRKTISLIVFKGSSPKEASAPPGPAPALDPKEGADCSSGNTFIVLSVVLLILLLLALLTSIALGVRHYKLLERTGNREAEDTSDKPQSRAQPGRRESSQDDSKGPAYINLDVQSQPSLEDPLYCNVEPSQAHRNPQHVEYAVIAFNQSPRSGKE
ncbi:CLM9 protein, partial [Hippolais icterina]|nr:CLM9 protein [Hippolais icterina]